MPRVEEIQISGSHQLVHTSPVLGWFTVNMVSDQTEQLWFCLAGGRVCLCPFLSEQIGMLGHCHKDLSIMWLYGAAFIASKSEGHKYKYR